MGMLLRLTTYFKAEYWSRLLLASGLLVLIAATILPGDEEKYNRMDVLAGKAVIIDPGHGGVDGGAVSALGDFEKEITLQIGSKITEKLRAVGANVIMTRDSDVDYYTKGKGGKRNDLEKRIEITQEHQAELFVSVHANAIKGERWSGAQVFYHPTSVEGKSLAETVQHYLRNFPPGNKRGVKSDDYYILRKNTIPSIIVEVGFLSNAEEAGRLKDEAYQEKLAEAVVRGIAHYVILKQEAGKN
jgi:N-acetylmuramoyl-L-alanine amidase